MKNLVLASAMALTISISIAPHSSRAGNAPKDKQASLRSIHVDDPSYNVAYDSFVLGALPIWITRSFDDGPKRLTISIRFENSSYTSYE
ncbi:hypothetical protein [Pedobacter sp. SYP-B3415]|uniref:hypothetical protein n=1 Tax=Pedobacter sp. SYP-B3415 TaxID=2496641 RepID=UPI00101C5701|nr:hypothetical protein [Pedobacter sp. SYP-B3415]